MQCTIKAEAQGVNFMKWRKYIIHHKYRLHKVQSHWGASRDASSCQPGKTVLPDSSHVSHLYYSPGMHLNL